MKNDTQAATPAENTDAHIAENAVEAIEPAIIEENFGLKDVGRTDWDGLTRFTEVYGRTIKEMYYAGYEAGKNSSVSTPRKTPKDTGHFIAVADNKAYAVYNSEEKFESQKPFWNAKVGVVKDFGKGGYEQAVNWAADQASLLSGVSVNKIPPLVSINYYTKVR